MAFPGRLRLIKVVLTGMIQFCFSCFVFPQRVIKELTSIFKKFLWPGSDLGKKHNPIKWDTVCLPYEEGGLGVKDLSISNTASNLRHI